MDTIESIRTLPRIRNDEDEHEDEHEHKGRKLVKKEV